MPLQTDVEAMLKAGVPEPEIAKFVQGYRHPEKQPPEGTNWTKAGYELVGGVGGAGLATLTSGNPLAAYYGMGLGQAAGGQAYDIINELVYGAPSKSLPQRSVEAAESALMGATFPRALELGGAALRAGGRSALSPIRKALSSPGSSQILKDFTRLGVRPTAGAVSGRPFIQGLEETASAMPGSAGTIQRVAAQSVGETGRAATDLAGEFGPVLTPQGAGGEIVGAAKHAVKRFKGRAGQLFEAVGKHFQPGERVPVSKTVDFLKGEVSKYTKAPELGKKFNAGISDIMRRVRSDAPDGLLDFTALKALRTEIGQKLGDPMSAVDDISRAQLKRLYGVLSDDIGMAAKSKGVAAEKAAKLADRYYSTHMKNTIPLLDKILKQKTDEAAFNAAVQAAKDGGSKLAKLRRSFTPAEWDSVAGTVLGRMGRSTPGQQGAAGDTFSVRSFLTNWNRLAPEAKGALFGGKRYAPLKNSLDSLVRVVEAQKDAAKFANVSKTGTINAFFSTVMGPLTIGLATSPGKGVATAAVLGSGQYGMGRLITSPSFVRWLAGAAKVPANNPNAMRVHMLRLAALAKKQPDIAGYVDRYVQSLGYPVETQNDTGPQLISPFKGR